MKEKREEDEKVTTELLLNDHVDRKLKFKIIENNLTKIEYGLERIFKYTNNNIGGYEEGIKFVKDLITQDKIIYTKENIIMLDDKMLIKYDKINSIKFNEIELREYKYYYKLINESKLSNKKLLDINVDTEEVSLTSINNDKFLKSFIETNNVDITTDVLKHTVNEKLYKLNINQE